MVYKWKWELLISYNNADEKYRLDLVAELIIGKRSLLQDCVWGSIKTPEQRFMHFFFETKKEAIAARRRIKLDGRFLVERFVKLKPVGE